MIRYVPLTFEAFPDAPLQVLDLVVGEQMVATRARFSDTNEGASGSSSLGAQPLTAELGRCIHRRSSVGTPSYGADLGPWGRMEIEGRPPHLRCCSVTEG